MFCPGFACHPNSKTWSVRGNHVVVEKDKGVPKGRDHLNGIEGFWSYAKDFFPITGVYQENISLYISKRLNSVSTTEIQTSYQLLEDI